MVLSQSTSLATQALSTFAASAPTAISNTTDTPQWSAPVVFGIILALFAVVVGLPGAILAMEALRRRRAIHEATGVDIDVEASNVHETIVDSLELHYQENSKDLPDGQVDIREIEARDVEVANNISSKSRDD